MYRYQEIIRLHHTDAAGVVFFSNLFVIAHNAYESFLESCLSLNKILSEGSYILPIVHAEADYSLPLTLSDNITVELSLGRIGNASFELEYVIKNDNMQIAAQVKTVHAVQLKGCSEKKPFPEPLKNALEKL